MQICSQCGEEKPEEEYSWKYKERGIRCDHCKLCHSVYLKQHYQKHKAYYVKKARQSKIKQFKLLRERIHDYLRLHPCVDCGEVDPVVLEFDHVRGVKLNSVSRLATSGAASWVRVEEEIAKCEVRCANCHRRRTAKSQGWYGTLSGDGLTVDSLRQSFRTD